MSHFEETSKLLQKDSILIVDDDGDILNVYKLMLQDTYTVFTAPSTNKALERIRKTLPTLILTDVNMPGRTGLFLAKMVRHEHPEIPILMISGFKDPEVYKKALEVGVFDFLTKPVTEEELHHSIEKALKYYKDRSDKDGEKLSHVEKALKSISNKKSTNTLGIEDRNQLNTTIFKIKSLAKEIENIQKERTNLDEKVLELSLEIQEQIDSIDGFDQSQKDDMKVS
jgi:YesN/AraC family two-component response regulator